MSAKVPLFSIVIPAYNAARWLQPCLDSVLAQTFGRWEAIVHDNASTDVTSEVAAGYHDPRLRVVRRDCPVSMQENWNRALREISPASDYFLLLPADDELRPDLLRRAADLIARRPEVDLICTEVERGGRIECRGLPRSQELFDGREVGRASLRRELFVLHPTGNVLRSSFAREREAFYPGHYTHEDLAAYFSVLHRAKVGFIHEPLFFSRVHADSTTATVASPRHTLLHDWLHFLAEYGPNYFAPDELDREWRRLLQRYDRVLLRGRFRGMDAQTRRYHFDSLRQLGAAPGVWRWTRAALAEAVAVAKQPAVALAYLTGRRAPPVTAHP